MLAMTQFGHLLEKQGARLRTMSILRACGEESKAELLHVKIFSPANSDAALDITLKDPKSEPWVSLLGERRTRDAGREYVLSRESFAQIHVIYRALAIGYSLGMEDVLEPFAQSGSDLCKQVLKEKPWLD
ncbi:MAG: hypothetical protein JNK71_10325 [Methyloversatilis sp.]|nr:hypothetical protein [Methyloversatilis sp.]